MRRALFAGVLFASACGPCTSPPPAPPPPPVADLDEPELPDVLRPGRIYRDAYERGRRDINADNAAERLDAIEGEIDLEGSARDAAGE